MIIDSNDLEKWRRACQISAQALEYARTIAVKGANVVEVCDKIDQKIITLGAKPSFPSQISINNIAAHYCGDKEDPMILEGVAKIDVGAQIDGFAGDTATTIDFTGEHKNLIIASQEAIKAGYEVLRPGVTLGEIGQAIEKKITEHGLKPIRNLSGHGIGKYEIHTSPTVPNFASGEKTKLEEGQIITLEPFVTNGQGFVFESGQAGVFSLNLKKPVREQFQRDLMNEIEKEYGTLPFAKRWLTRKYSPVKVTMALNSFVQQGIITAYPPLIEKGKGLVSQAEHTFLIKEKTEILTKI